MATPTTMPLRILKRSLLDTRWASASLPRRSITTQHTPTSNTLPEHLLQPRAHPIPSRDIPTTIHQDHQPRTRSKRKVLPIPPPAIPRSAPPKPEATHTDAALDPSIAQLLPLLKAQASYYARVHVHGKPYLVTPGDTIRLPFLMHGVTPGDILRLNRASLLGSRDYTLRAGSSSTLPRSPDAGAEEQRDGRGLKDMGFIDERLFECRARVMGVEMEPMRVKEKTKRRQRHIRRVRSKHAYTVLRVMEIGVADAEGLVAPGSVEGGIVAKNGVQEAVGKMNEVGV